MIIWVRCEHPRVGSLVRRRTDMSTCFRAGKIIALDGDVARVAFGADGRFSDSGAHEASVAVSELYEGFELLASAGEGAGI